MKKSVIIIGAGITGLAAGCYAQMNGYDSIIFEMHDKPGGLCTSWQRKGYTIDGCIHYLTGTSSNSGYYKIWQELGAIQGRQIINHSEFLRIQGSEGKNLILYADINQLEQHLKEIAPEDKELITDFIKIVRKMSKFNPPIDKASEVRGKLERWLNFLKALPLICSLKKYGKMTIGDFANLFKNQFLHETFPLLFFGLNDFPLMALMGFIGYFSAGNCGYPLEGSLQFAKSIEKRYKNLGGRISYCSKVERLIIENDHVVGVILADGTERMGDNVISAADGRWTIFDLLKKKYTDDTILGYYNNLPVYPPCVYITLCINKDLSSYPHGVYYHLEEPLVVADVPQSWLGIQHYGYDKTLAPEGKSIVNVMILTVYEYWESLYKNRLLYKEEKKRLADRVISELEKRYAVIREQIEVIDVATPVTFRRYTGTWKGSFMGWKPDVNIPRTIKSKTLPGLLGFYMAGQWVEYTGGIPAAAKSGRDVVQIICKADNKDFIANMP